MSICNIDNQFFKLIILLIILSINSSCTIINNDIEPLIEEIAIDEVNYIESGEYKSFNSIINHWDNQNQKSYSFNYNFEKLFNLDFGSGENKINFLISNPILIDNNIYLIDNKALLTKYDVSSNSLVWQKNVNENIQQNVSAPASLVATKDSIIITTGEGNVNSIDFDGNIIWSKNFNMSIKTASYLLNDLIIVSLNDGNLLFLNSKNGSIKLSFNKKLDKIPSFYGGKFYNYRNNLFSISPKNNIYFIDNLLYEYSELEKNFFDSFEPINQFNFDYNVKLFTYQDYLIIVENNEYYSLYNIFNNKLEIYRYELPPGNFTTVINNTIFSLDNENQIRAINIQNNKMFWKLNLDKYLKNNVSIIHIVESENYLHIFLENGNIFDINKLNGDIINISKLNINKIKSVYFHKKYILFITKKAKLYVYQ